MTFKLTIQTSPVANPTDVVIRNAEIAAALKRLADALLSSNQEVHGTIRINDSKGDPIGEAEFDDAFEAAKGAAGQP